MEGMIDSRSEVEVEEGKKKTVCISLVAHAMLIRVLVCIYVRVCTC